MRLEPWSHMRLPLTDRWSVKDEFVAAKPVSSTRPLENEAHTLVKCQNIVGARDLVRIAADPVDEVSPSRHAAKPRGPPLLLKQFAPQDIAHDECPRKAGSDNAKKQRA